MRVNACINLASSHLRHYPDTFAHTSQDFLNVLFYEFPVKAELFNSKGNFVITVWSDRQNQKTNSFYLDTRPLSNDLLNDSPPNSVFISYDWASSLGMTHGEVVTCIFELCT